MQISFLDILAMPDINQQDRYRLLVNQGKQTIVANAITPFSAMVALQRFPCAKRVFAVNQVTFDPAQYQGCFGFIKLLQELECPSCIKNRIHLVESQLAQDLLVCICR